MSTYNWIVENWEDIVKLYFAVVAVASIVIKVTPTVKDDHFLKEFLRFTGKYIALNRK